MKILVCGVLFLMVAVWAYWISEFLRFRDTNIRVQQLLDECEQEKTKETRKNLDMWI
jgi:hypothetical protein